MDKIYRDVEIHFRMCSQEKITLEELHSYVRTVIESMYETHQEMIDEIKENLEGILDRNVN